MVSSTGTVPFSRISFNVASKQYPMHSDIGRRVHLLSEAISFTSRRERYIDRYIDRERESEMALLATTHDLTEYPYDRDQMDKLIRRIYFNNRWLDWYQHFRFHSTSN